MRAVRDMLEASGFDMAHYHQESFSVPVVEEVSAPFSGDDARGDQADAMPIQFAVSGIEGQCQPGQTVLQTARASGVRISAACEFGLCGTCKVRKLSGEVEMSHNGGILDDEIAEGFVLACCSKPLTPLEIEA
jgi:ferredoxin